MTESGQATVSYNGSPPVRPTYRTVIVEPLGRSTGHQTWYASGLVASLLEAGFSPTLITFDGLNDEADLAYRDKGCEVIRARATMPRWARWLFARLTGVLVGRMASPSASRWKYRIYFYNHLATILCTVTALRYVKRRNCGPLHMLCPPTWSVLRCIQALGYTDGVTIFTTFGAPRLFHGGQRLRRKLCQSHRIKLLVQTEALSSEWAGAVGANAVAVIPMPSGTIVQRGDERSCRQLLDLPLDKRIVAVIGCMAPSKGYVELLEALQREEKYFFLLLIGDTPEWIVPRPEEVVARCGWSDGTIFRNQFVTEAVWPLLLGAVNAVALLYREPNASSGILSLCEQYGVPVLATCHGDLGQRVSGRRLGVTADPKDPGAIRGALRELLGDACQLDYQTRRAGVARQVSDSISWQDAAVAHLHLYASLTRN